MTDRLTRRRTSCSFLSPSLADALLSPLLTAEAVERVRGHPPRGRLLSGTSAAWSLESEPVLLFFFFFFFVRFPSCPLHVT